jgi:hypothetical protein
MEGDLTQLQEYVWDLLPQRKHRLGREVIYDAVAAAVAEWPEDAFAQTSSGDTAELEAAEDLGRSMRRHMQLLYGEERYGSLWIIALQLLLPIVIDLILRWWRRDATNRRLLRRWRRQWTKDEG